MTVNVPKTVMVSIAPDTNELMKTCRRLLRTQCEPRIVHMVGKPAPSYECSCTPAILFTADKYIKHLMGELLGDEH